jgi:hypothetical protein
MRLIKKKDFPTYKSDLLMSVTVRGSTTVKIRLHRHKNYG